MTEEQAYRFRRVASERVPRLGLPAWVDRGDVVSEALLSAHTGPPYDPERGEFVGWVTHHLWIAGLRVRERTVRAESRKALLEHGAADGAALPRFREADRQVAREDAAPRARRPVALGSQEERVLRAFLDLGTAREVGEFLGLSPRTVETHLDGVYRKLGVGRLHLALVEAVRRGIVVF